MKLIILIATSVCLFILLMVVGGFWLDSKYCLTAYQEYQPNWSVWGGCRVMWDGKLTPVDIIREIK